MAGFSTVRERLIDARAIAWDTCHKIYILMDVEQVAQMRGYGYGDSNDPDSLITDSEMGTDEMFAKVLEWYNNSCSLRFIEAISTMPEGEDPILGYETLIGQGV